MLLAIDSATRILSIALHDGSRVIAESTWDTPNRHTVELTPAIQYMLDRAHQPISELTMLAVSQGPGSFNGLRIGFSVAKGLAMALGIPLIAIPTLDIVATAQPGFPGLLIAVLQAGRGRICAGGYRWQEGHDPGWHKTDDVKIISWESLLDSVMVETGETLICGEIDEAGQRLIEQLIEQSDKSIRIARPAFSLRRAGFLAELAWTRWRNAQSDDQTAHQIGDPALATPLYLHQPGVPNP
jgi:tRNA threonylcarbamoyladenosine biosynthesis protein TsaB